MYQIIVNHMLTAARTIHWPAILSNASCGLQSCRAETYLLANYFFESNVWGLYLLKCVSSELG